MITSPSSRPRTHRASRTPLGLVCCYALLTLSSWAQTQPQRPLPRLGFVYPAGGQEGTTFTATIAGQNLAGATALTFSLPGATARVVSYDRPLTQAEFNDAREKQQALLEKRAAARSKKEDVIWTPDDERRLQELQVLVTKRPNRILTPALAETLTVEITLPPNSAPSIHELRVSATAGLSNPMVFQVGTLPEVTPPVVVPTTNYTDAAGTPRQVTAATIPAPSDITLPAIVNGQILPGEVDRFRFPAAKGQRLVVTAQARSLIPYLADAVPGWFQAVLAVRNDQGQELAYNDSFFATSPDPVLVCTLPENGIYTVEIRDSIYRGREDFVYRIALGELPLVASVFPLGGRAGVETPLELDGWNLSSDRIIFDATTRQAGEFVVSTRTGPHFSNPVTFPLGTLDEQLETEGNDTAANAQLVTTPLVVNGRIERKGDRDTFRFSGRGGEEIVAQITARRLNSPLDSVLTIVDDNGRELARNDDWEDKREGLLTHHADSYLRVTLPVDGFYYVQVEDRTRAGGRDYAYRLRLGAPEPDFSLRVIPATINARGGGCVPITVHAIRRDGFTGEITLGLHDSPAGFTLSGGRIPAGHDKIQLTLTAPTPPQPNSAPMDLRIAGVATIGGRRVVRPATPAEDMMQAFFYRHLVASRELKVAVLGRAGITRVVSRLPLQLKPGDNNRVQFAAGALRNVSKIEAELIDPPEGIKVQGATLRGDIIEVTLVCDPAKVKTGLQGNLLFKLNGERSASGQKNAPAAGRFPLSSVPAIPFDVAPVAAPLAKHR